MQLSFLPQAHIVQGEVAAAQAVAPQLTQVSSGSVAYALFQGFASVCLWLQWLIAQVLSMTRLATSQGADVDSFVGDFGLARLPATSATGSVTFSRYSTSGTALVVPGAQVKTADGSQPFVVTTDTTNAAWNATLGGYVVANGVGSVTVPVQAANAGTQGNVQAATITLIASAIPGIDTVTNASAFTNALNAETDAALRARFAAYIQALSKSTLAAIGYAVESVEQGLSYVIQEGAPGTAAVTVTVDDGSGTPSSTLLSNVATSIAAVRAAGVEVVVQGPSVTDTTVAFTLNVTAGTSKPAAVALITPALLAYVDALPVGVSLAVSNVIAQAYAAAPGMVGSIEALLLNGGSADINPGATGVVKVTGGAAGIVIS
jgi:uncharacterized phage protein gp47/JayE